MKKQRLIAATLVWLLLSLAACSQPAAESSWPDTRIHPSMFYDADSGHMLVVSGMSAMQSNVDLNEVWSFEPDGGAWAFVGEMAPKDAMINLGFDEESGRIIALNLSPTETWAYDIATGEWTRQSPDIQPEAGPPNKRFGAPLVYDSESDRLIMFAGGSPWFMYDDTWAYDFNTDTWERMNPAVSPSPRAMYAAAYDAESDRVILWGGFTGTDENDVQIWAYDYNSDSWEALPNTDGPQQHHERHGMVYLPDRDLILFYSGMLEDGGTLGPETWYYDYNTNAWTEVDVTTSPPKLAMYAMARDPETGKVYVYGGEMTAKYARDFSNDVWMFDPAEEDWSVLPEPAGN